MDVCRGRFEGLFGHGPYFIRVVVVFANVDEDHLLELVVADVVEEGGHVLVGKVSVAATDTLLDLWGVVAKAEHVGAIVRFKEDGVAALEPVADKLGTVAHVGGETEFRALVCNGEPYWVDGIVGYGEGLDLETFKVDGFTGFEEADRFYGADVLGECSHGGGGDVNGDRHLSGEYADAGYVVGMLVGNKDCVEVVNGRAGPFCPLRKLFKA